jgi:hypothetical protein
MMVVVDDGGHDLGDCNQDGKIADGEKSALIPDDALAGDAYDYFLIERDKSFGFHNPTFTRATLTRLTR